LPALKKSMVLSIIYLYIFDFTNLYRIQHRTFITLTLIAPFQMSQFAMAEMNAFLLGIKAFLH
jgi:hypothetical protein